MASGNIVEARRWEIDLVAEKWCLWRGPLLSPLTLSEHRTEQTHNRPREYVSAWVALSCKELKM